MTKFTLFIVIVFLLHSRLGQSQPPPEPADEPTATAEYELVIFEPPASTPSTLATSTRNVVTVTNYTTITPTKTVWVPPPPPPPPPVIVTTLLLTSYTTKGQTPTVTITYTTLTVPPPRPAIDTPVPDWDEIHCYNSGQWSRRFKMIDAIECFCKKLAEDNAWRPLPAGYHFRTLASFPCCDPWEVMPITIYTSIEIKDGCEWVVDRNECGLELRKIVDRCDTDGEDRKQGGKMQNNCIKWKIDPEMD